VQGGAGGSCIVLGGAGGSWILQGGACVVPHSAGGGLRGLAYSRVGLRGPT
jgi:hypothetical protein